jgi:hypothetical protein
MSVREIRYNLQRLADRGKISESRVIPLTIATVLETGQQAFHAAYYGAALTKQIDDVRGMDQAGKDSALLIMESFITDLEKTNRANKETLTTSDFPLALARARQAAARPGYVFPESDLPKFAARRTAADFKVLKGNRPGSIGHRFLPVRPESTNIEYTKFFTSDEGYTVADMALAIPFTWESYINDDLGDFISAATDMGNVARRSRAAVIVDAVLRLAARVPLIDGEFGPTIDNLDAVAEFMANQTDTLTGRRVGRKPTDVFVPTKWERKALRSMAPERLSVTGGAAGPLDQVVDINPVYGMAAVHVEDLIGDLVAEYPERYDAKDIGPDDWLALDGRNSPIELATLRGYEGGPKTFTRMVNVDETDLEGDFDNRGFAMKVHDVCGAFLRDKYGAVIAQGD